MTVILVSWKMSVGKTFFTVNEFSILFLIICLLLKYLFCRKCINEMGDRAFNVYNEFYIHAIHICFFLNHEAWQSEIDNTINL